MITEFLMSVGASIAQFFLGLFPTGPVAPFIGELDDKVNVILAGLNGVGVWVDWTFSFAVVAVVLAAWGIVLGVRALLTLWSLVPVVGGGK